MTKQYSQRAALENLINFQLAMKQNKFCLTLLISFSLSQNSSNAKGPHYGELQARMVEQGETGMFFC